MGYAPNNCTLVMVGDVRFDQVMALAKKYLEPIPRQEPPPPVRTKEPAQQGERRVTLVEAGAAPAAADPLSRARNAPVRIRRCSG